jgi:hypothetical protein
MVTIKIFSFLVSLWIQKVTMNIIVSIDTRVPRALVTRNNKYLNKFSCVDPNGNHENSQFLSKSVDSNGNHDNFQFLSWKRIDFCGSKR